MPTATKTTGSQFDDLLAPRKRPHPEQADMTPVGVNDTAPTSRPSTAKSGTKSLAKSKDHAYQGRTFYVRKKTYAECDYILRSNDDPRDMSDLAEELLTAWLAKDAKRSAI